MKGNAYTLCFAGALGIICALLLTAVGSFTAPYKERNALAEETENILKVLKVSVEEGATADVLVQLRKDSVEEPNVPPGAQKIYINKQTGAMAMQFAGPGLWGPIKGLLALEKDRKTILGITFYEQEETPGLGAEIAGDVFCNSFIGKTIYGPDGKPGLEVAMPGSPEAVNRVDGITGATMTCDKVQAMLTTAVENFVKEK